MSIQNFGDVFTMDVSQYINYCMAGGYNKELEMLAYMLQSLTNRIPDERLQQLAREEINQKREELSRLHRRAIHNLEGSGIL